MHPTSPPDSPTRPPEDVPSYDAHPLAPDSPILRPLLAAAKVPVFSIDHGGILIHASEALLTALHRPASGVLGHPLATLLTEQSASALATAMALTATYSPQACTPLTLCFVPANTTEPAPTLRFSLVALAAESGMVFHGIGTTPHPVPEARGRYYELFHHCPTPRPNWGLLHYAKWISRPSCPCCEPCTPATAHSLPNTLLPIHRFMTSSVRAVRLSMSTVPPRNFST